MELLNQTVEECDSTNDLAVLLGQGGAPSGSWVSARKQLRGRGRQGRSWVSEEGNLFLSMVLRDYRSEWITWLPLCAALGVAEAVSEVHPEVEIRVKWPNDIWLQGAKCGGILCEAQSGFVVIGLGLNCVSEPRGLDQDTISLSRVARGSAVSADRLRGAVVSSWLLHFEMLRERGPAALRERYELCALFEAGTSIEWGGAQGVRFGKVVGLGPAAELEVEVECGRVSLFAEDVKVRASRSKDD